MSLTSIADQRTPGRPVEITFAADTGLPSANQEVLLIGHAGTGATSGTAEIYSVVEINNSGDLAAASGEANAKFGAGTELAKMVIAAVAANAGSSTYPRLKACALASTDADFGSADVALTNVMKVKAEFVVSCYDGDDDTLRDKLKTAMLTMSGAQRVDNNQFGSVGVVFNRDVADPSDLPVFDSRFLMGCWMPDSGSPDYSIGEMAAACAAVAAANAVPFNPLDDKTLQNVAAPESSADYITVGASLESETALNKGWTPLKVKPNGEVAFVRTITGRVSADGSGIPVVTSYYDLQDFQVLYFWRKTIWTRFSQPDLKQAKASNDTAKIIKSELIRLATTFEDQNMFQAVAQLAKLFQVERSLSDRSRFDVKTPINVIPGLHVIAANIEATTQFDTISV